MAKHQPQASITGIARIEGRPAVIVANDATVKAGAWWPETITKILRAQEIALRNRAPIVYLVDSAGVNLPYQDGIFPGQYGAGRIFFYNSQMRKLRIPQIAAVMGPCIAGGAYLPALSDFVIMVEKHQLHGPGRREPRQRRNGPAHRSGDPRWRSYAYGTLGSRPLPCPVGCIDALVPDSRLFHGSSKTRIAQPSAPAPEPSGLYEILPRRITACPTK